MNDMKKLKTTWMPDVMSAEEAMTWLNSKDVDFDLCDTPVPLLGNTVSCGLPLGIGDELIEGYYYLPKSKLGNNPIVDWPARGDSMIGDDIEEGDILRVELGALPRDGEVVIASLDDELTCKVFFNDAQGRRWLCPRNSRYDCILLTERLNVRIVGVVRNVLKQAPVHSFRECQGFVDETLSRQQVKQSLMERVEQAVCKGASLFWAAAAWSVVYGLLRDCCDYEETVIDFERAAAKLKLTPTFEHRCGVGKVQRTLSNHPYMRMHVDKWEDNGAAQRELKMLDFMKQELQDFLK